MSMITTTLLVFDDMVTLILLLMLNYEARKGSIKDTSETFENILICPDVTYFSISIH